MVNLLGVNHETNYCMYAIDSSSDLKSLPTSVKFGTDALGNKLDYCAQGSIARCLDGSTYMLSGKNVWTKYSTSGGGSGGSTADFDVSAIGDEFIDSLFDS